MRGRWEYVSIWCLSVGTDAQCTQVVAGVGVGVEGGVNM